jgi:hypothetical protein
MPPRFNPARCEISMTQIPSLLEFARKADQLSRSRAPISEDDLAVLRLELLDLKDKLLKSQELYQKMVSIVRKSISEPPPQDGAPTSESVGGSSEVETKPPASRRRRGGQIDPPAPILQRGADASSPPLALESSRSRPPRRVRRGGRRRADLWNWVSPLFGKIPTVETIEKLCAPIDTNIASVKLSTPWHLRIDAIRDSAPPDVRERLKPLDIPDELDPENQLADRLLSALMPVRSPIPEPFGEETVFPDLPITLHDVPYVESDPYLSHPFPDRLRFELESIDLLGDSLEEEKTEEDHGGANEADMQLGTLKAKAARIQEGIDAIKDTILENHAEWEHERNDMLMTEAAFRKKPS